MNDVNKNGRRVTTVVVPADIHRALIRNKVKYSDYLNAKVVMDTLSTLDARYWSAVTEVIKIGGHRLGQTLASAYTSSNMDSVIQTDTNPSSKHNDIFYCPNNVDKEDANSRLFLSNAMTENFYSIRRDGSCVFVIVEDGFCHHLEEPSNKLNFLRTYFATLSELMPVEMLAKDPLHLQYVSLLTS